MSALHALSAARSAGVRIRLDGDTLDLSAEREPPKRLLELLHCHKPELLRLLHSSLEGWSAEDWQVFFNERAAICEFDGGLSRPGAEGCAFACCVSEWLNRNTTPSAHGHCLSCIGGDRDGDPLLPFGTETSGHAWVHRSCWPAWHQAREAEAVAALISMGIRGEHFAIDLWQHSPTSARDHTLSTPRPSPRLEATDPAQQADDTGAKKNV
jgi:hypothetical protein